MSTKDYTMKHRITEGTEIIREIEKHYRKVQEIYLCSPFLTQSAIKAIFRVLIKKSTIRLVVITKYEPLDLLLGSSEIEAFELLFEKAEFKKWNIDIYIVSNLHAKVILLGTQAAIVGSANITHSGLNRNRELGVTISGGDSKILTVRDYLRQLMDSGYRLTRDQLEWFRKHHLPKYEKRAIGIKAMLREFRREFDAGLMGFASLGENEQRIGYFRSVVRFLEFVLTSGQRSRLECLTWLTKRSLMGGEKINEDRLSLLGNLGLIIESERGIALTGEGSEIAKKKSPDRFYKGLIALFPEFEQIEQALRQHGEIHASMLVRETDSRQKNRYWESRLRWMESLERVKSFRRGRSKYYSLPHPQVSKPSRGHRQ